PRSSEAEDDIEAAAGQGVLEIEGGGSGIVEADGVPAVAVPVSGDGEGGVGRRVDGEDDRRRAREQLVLEPEGVAGRDVEAGGGAAVAVPVAGEGDLAAVRRAEDEAEVGRAGNVEILEVEAGGGGIVEGRRVDRALRHDAVEVAVEAGGVELAVAALAEGGERADAVRQHAYLPAGALAVGGPDAAAAEVAEEVAAGHRAFVAVVVLQHRRREARRAAGRSGDRAGLAGVAEAPFHDLPAVVLAAMAPGTRRRLEVDLLPDSLSHVADPQVAGLAVEGEAPRIA